jgi:hypothetical protein
MNNNISPKKDELETYKKRECIYIFWTGGYDSTFRICQALIDEKKNVQPIYISAIIDNIPTKEFRRKNQHQEIFAVNEVTKALHKNFPFTKKKLLPLLDIKDVSLDKDIEKHMKILSSQKKVRRAVCQYGSLAQTTRNLKKNIELCVENEETCIMNRTLRGQIHCNGNICKIKDNLSPDNKSLIIFKDFILPIIRLSKKDMLKIAQKNGYADILKLTWSCWFPNNGRPCGKCDMCKERII